MVVRVGVKATLKLYPWYSTSRSNVFRPGALNSRAPTIN